MPDPQPSLPPQDDPPAFGRYMPALDGLRGIAVLAVMIMHFAYYFYDALSTTQIGRIYIRATSKGWMGVDLFFALSGFLITGILLDSKGSPHFFRNFYARRTLRIFPLYYGVVAVVFLLLPLTPMAPAGLEAVRPHQAWLWLYGTNFAVYWFGWDYLNPYPVMVTHFWSLAVEEHFYLVWPLVVYLSSKKSLVGISFVFVIISIASRYLLIPYSHNGTASLLTPCRTDELALGGLLALACRTYSADHILKILRPIGVCAAVILVGQLVVHSALLESRIPGVLQGTVLGLFSSWLVAEGALMNARSFFMPLLAKSPLATLGRYSYGAYVFHQLLNRVLYESIGTRLSYLGPTPRTVLYSCIAGTISVAAAFVSFHCCEKWFLRMKRHFPPREPMLVPTFANQEPGGKKEVLLCETV